MRIATDMTTTREPDRPGPIDALEIAPLLDRAVAAIGGRNWEEARSVLTSLMTRAPLPIVRNNLAVVVLEHDDDPSGAYDLIAPIFEDPTAGPQPFAHALAVRCLAAMGQIAQAREHMSAAVMQLEAGLRGQRPAASGPDAAWREYTVALLRAAGSLEDDGLAWEIYQQFQSVHNRSEAHYLGGIAAFNRRRWAGAQRSWARVAGEDWGAVDTFSSILPAMDAGTVPPFRLPYEVPDLRALVMDGKESGLMRLVAATEEESPDPERVAALQTLVQHPQHWAALLAFCLTNVAGEMPPEARGVLLQGVVRFGSERGRELADALFRSGSAPLELKMAAANGLVRMGHIQNGTHVTMLIDGRSREVQVFLSRMVLGDAEMDARYREGIDARDEGRLEEAHRILGELADFQAGDAYLPAVIAYANLLRGDGLFQKARQLLDLAAKVDTAQPTVLFNQAALSFQVRDYARAKQQILSLEEMDLSKDLRDMVRQLREQLVMAERMEAVFDDLPIATRDRFEDRPAAVDTDLRHSLALLPVRWLDASCMLYGLEIMESRRPQREQALLRKISEDGGRAVRHALETDPRGELPALLSFLMRRGGWAPKDEVDRRFGSEQRDRIHRPTDRAYSTLGHARLAALVYVGTARVKGIPARIAGIPTEMREWCGDLA